MKERRRVKGQSLALSAWPHSPVGFPPSLCPPLPSVPRSLLHIYIHLSTLCVALFCRERGCAARLTRCVTPAVTAAHAFLQIIFASFLCCVQALVHAVDAHLHETSMRRLSGQVCVSPCTSVCACGCVYACVLPGQDKASPPPSPSRHTLLALHAPSHSHHPPPPLNAHTHTHLPHFACVIPASWPCWLIPLH